MRDVPSHLDGPLDRIHRAVTDLDTAVIRAQRFAGANRCIQVDDAVMEQLAASGEASPALRQYASRVAAGQCRWSEIEAVAHPVPPEVAELKANPRFRWFPASPRTTPAAGQDQEPYRIPWQS
ncbi:hypothetical protein F1734_24595 [Rhodococcus ruber]|uniref:hypothetical protein n=1 Tax=Rhodococcus ruber TaxID=1830 RepID=UPI00193385C1|nr:hypothetical protein [Rhodococcus ruber]QRE83103.1 hypothetical protein F1734_24595 [Rhodococcus ruber]